MTKMLNQARGSSTDMVIGFEGSYATPPEEGGYRISFNSSSIAASRELNTAATIQPGRSPIEPFQGNGSVDGDFTLPLDLDQIGIFLKAAFGEPETSAPASEIGLSSVADNSSSLPGTVTLTLAGTGIASGDRFIVWGTENYNGSHIAISVSGTSVVIRHDYVEETFSGAKCSTGGFTHVFRIGDEQPSFTVEQLHKDVAERFVYTGCKISKLSFSASTDGQEATYTASVMGAKPLPPLAPSPITAASSSEGTLRLTTVSGHGLSVGDEVCVAGIPGVSGRLTVTASDETTFSVKSSAPAPSIIEGQEPVWTKAQVKVGSAIAIRRLGTFSARILKDGKEYTGGKSFSMEVDMGLDGDQRVIGDDGYRSSIPEGTVSISSSLTAIFRDGELFRAGAANETIGFELRYTVPNSSGSLTFTLPENKVSETAPAVDSPRGLSQEISCMAFCTDAASGGSALTVTLVNSIPSYN